MGASVSTAAVALSAQQSEPSASFLELQAQFDTAWWYGDWLGSSFASCSHRCAPVCGSDDELFEPNGIIMDALAVNHVPLSHSGRQHSSSSQDRLSPRFGILQDQSCKGALAAPGAMVTLHASAVSPPHSPVLVNPSPVATATTNWRPAYGLTKTAAHKQTCGHQSTPSPTDCSPVSSGSSASVAAITLAVPYKSHNKGLLGAQAMLQRGTQWWPLTNLQHVAQQQQQQQQPCSQMMQAQGFQGAWPIAAPTGLAGLAEVAT